MSKSSFIIGKLMVLIMLIFIVSGCTTSENKQTQLEPIKEPEITKYSIDFTAKHISSRSFEVTGTTNLPSNSKIHITIYNEDYFEHDDADQDWRLENLTYFEDSTTVNNGKFTKTVAGTEIEAPMKSEKYKVEVSFNPRAQNNSIKNIVGENGEYLDGNLLDNSISGLKMLKTSTIVGLKKEIPYRIIEEEDISYLGCKRVGIRIVVPDNSDKTNVESVMEKIINDNKSKWSDITVWAFKYSEEDQIGKIGHTMGMKEYSTCN